MDGRSRPKVAYVVLWLPEPSQTFVLDEVNTLSQLGLDLEVFTLYGPRSPRRVAGLPAVLPPVTRFGSRSLPQLLKNLAQLHSHFGPGAGKFLATVMLRRWRSLETAGEALWAALAGVHLARLLPARGVQHIHASWANGPATAAWVASRLSGIPFSFCARAHDIYPPDGALLEKLAAAAFVRTENDANLHYLAGLLPAAAPKLQTIYNGVPLQVNQTARPAVSPPYKILALGRFVVKKGFAFLLEACRLLAQDRIGFSVDPGRRRPGKSPSPGIGPKISSRLSGEDARLCGSPPGQPGSWPKPTSSSCPASWLPAVIGMAPPRSLPRPSCTRFRWWPPRSAVFRKWCVPVKPAGWCRRKTLRPWPRPSPRPWPIPPRLTAGPCNGGQLMREEFDSRKNYRRLMARFESLVACR